MAGREKALISRSDGEALNILACFNEERPWLTLTEVARDPGLQTHRRRCC